jgi:hypothetical protein
MKRHRIACLLLCLGCASANDRAPSSTTEAASAGPVTASAAVDSSAPIPSGIDWTRDLDSLAPNPFPPPSPTWIARFDGLGAVVVGLSVAEATARYGPGFAPPPDSEGCDYVSIPGGPPGAMVMVENDRLARIDIYDARLATDRGIRIGDTEADVRRAYPGLVRQEEHPYSGPEWHYLIVTPTRDSTYKLVLEIDGWRVVSFRVGLAKPVEYIEGCA